MMKIANSADKLAMTTQKQNRAATPGLSAWVSANAGSGKTHVLVKRVIRILLSGTLAHKILCLTFTKTAAAEMQNRLFKTLSEWAVMDDEKLIKSVFDTAAVALNPDGLGKARRLFAEALETPGGLKIQTVHAFCERILHTFPIEAGISPQFEVIDDRNAREMLSVIKRDVLNEAQSAEGKFGNIMPVISQYVNEAKFDELLNGLIKNRQKIAKLIGHDFADIKVEFTPFKYKPLGNLGGQLRIEEWLEAAKEKGVDVAEYYAEILADRNLWPLTAFKELAKALQEDGGGNNVKLAHSIETSLEREKTEPRLEAYFDIFFTKTRKPKAATWISKKVKSEYVDICELLEKQKTKAIEQFETLSAVKLYQASTALFEIGNAILWKFVQQKQAKSMVDYDDLINITAKLLNGDDGQNNGQTAWVLYKLDNGLDHILIDEAQDTSPAQWAVIEPLVKEITAGEGAHDAQRSLFVVGDEKQSIYKFQGADREEFKRKQIGFKQDFEAAGLAWENIELDLSFRSSSAILSAVDKVFDFAAAASGVYDDNAEQIKNDEITARHFAHRKVGGIVELWPVEIGLDVDVPNAWRAPVDELSPISPSRMLADKIAIKIAAWITGKRHLTSTNRAVKPSDILILVRRRNDFVNALIRALKKLDIPVAGIDRMRVRNELIVEDMIALGKFCLLPEDELNLAVILKSPFIGIDDEKLFELAHRREGNLWQSLGQAKAPEWRQIYAKLTGWRQLSQQIRPFDFYSQILSSEGMRRKLIARLGVDALDPLDEFLNLVENFELNHVADLNHLIKWIESDEEELKREIDQEKDEVRIMTVHGAKGLESNIVILPDTCAAPRRGRGDDLAFTDEFAYWRPSKNTEPNLVKQIKSANYIKEIEEYHRLLYVAMTRAGDELYIAGYAKKPATGKEEFYNWYQLVEQAMQGWATELDVDGQKVLRFETDGEIAGVDEQALADLHHIALPQWAFEHAPTPIQLTRPQAPSTLLESNWDNLNIQNFDLADIRLSPLQTDDKRRFLRGNIIHKLLENLPKLTADLGAIAMQNYLQNFEDDFNTEALAEIANEVTRIMNDEEFAALFGQNSQSEVSIVGEISLKKQKKLISGQIDRLVISGDEILILDYKSNRPPPKITKNVSLQYLGQMAAYRDLLRQTYPQHTIKTALLWTYTGDIMWLDDEQLDHAYQKIFA